ncbi:SoxR reducing system RseC family protein [Thalassotalea marina]|uniref:Sigma-E factor regulatory protein RseC n=1 Tax=Thalassotalea marina TaxID=1673741 RepID=A0A919BF00_9GAMM|nr:SoxR reducing system RseC family protein [Thalassotalea marina]GHF84509.1 sigma-E factor regulatory protein RseC [Thalassotalea marina]
MIEEIAQVTQINGTHITVRSTVKSSCSGCQQLENCGSGQIAKAFNHKAVEFSLVTEKKLTLGDQVLIGLPEKLLLSAAWQVYMWPLFGLILTSLLAQWALDSLGISHELFALAFGVVGGYVGYKLAQNRQSACQLHEGWQVKLIKVLPSNIPVEVIN